MSDLGAISSHLLAVRNLQMALIKNTVEMQQQAVEILLDDSRVVSASEILGTQIDINV